MATKKTKLKARKTKINWKALENEWRIGQVSNRALGRKYGVSEAAIRKRAKNEKWERSLQDAFDKALEDAIIKENAQNSARAISEGSQNEQAGDDDVVQAAVDTSLDVIKKHRADIKKMHELADLAAEEIREILETKTLTQHLWMIGEAKESVLGMLQKFGSIKERAILLERQAYNLDKKGHQSLNPNDLDLEGRIKQRMNKLKNNE